MSNEKTRVNIYMIDEALEYIDSQCAKYGMARGSYIAYVMLEKKKTDGIADTMVGFQKQLEEYQKEISVGKDVVLK